MPKIDAWMPFYPGDYLADTRRLSLEQHGAYLLLILDYWRNGPPPDDEATLSRIVGCTPAVWRRLALDLRQMFTVDGGQWKHKRVDAELIAAGERKTKAVHKAELAAAARWGKECAPSNAPSILQAVPEQCPSPSHSPGKTKARAARKRSAATPLPENFAISERVRKWAAAKGHTRLEQHLEVFLGKVAANGYVYESWDDALMNCIREDWGKVNSAKPVLSSVPLHASQVPAKVPGGEWLAHTDMPDEARAALDRFKATKVRA